MVVEGSGAPGDVTVTGATEYGGAPLGRSFSLDPIDTTVILTIGLTTMSLRLEYPLSRDTLSADDDDDDDGDDDDIAESLCDELGVRRATAPAHVEPAPVPVQPEVQADDDAGGNDEWQDQPPGPEPEQQLVDALQVPERALKAAKHIVRAEMTSPRLLLAMITAAAFPSEVRPLIEKSSSRVEGGVDAVIAAWPTLDDRFHGNALYAIGGTNRTDEQTAWMLERFRTALATEDDDAACAAAELAGRLAVRVVEFRLLVAEVRLQRSDVWRSRTRRVRDALSDRDQHT